MQEIKLKTKVQWCTHEVAYVFGREQTRYVNKKKSAVLFIMLVRFVPFFSHRSRVSNEELCIRNMAPRHTLYRGFTPKLARFSLGVIDRSMKPVETLELCSQSIHIIQQRSSKSKD